LEAWLLPPQIKNNNNKKEIIIKKECLKRKEKKLLGSFKRAWILFFAFHDLLERHERENIDGLETKLLNKFHDSLFFFHFFLHDAA